jgi:hypothetical protein
MELYSRNKLQRRKRDLENGTSYILFVTNTMQQFQILFEKFW